MIHLDDSYFAIQGFIFGRCSCLNGYEEKPLSLFVELANSFSLSGKHFKSTDALSVWSLLAKTYLKAALEALTTPQQLQEAHDYFMPEIKAKIQEKKTTYEWFTLFTDRLSILMTNPKERDIAPPFNTRIAAYKVALIASHFQNQPGWYTHEGYENACQTVGSKYTQNVLSPLALSKELFPNIVMLPYPFELSDGDILRTMPSPEGSHFWALGYAFDKTWADGGLLTPSIFRKHDEGHLTQMLWHLSSAGELFVKNEDTYIPTIEESWSNNRQGRNLYYAVLKRLQEMAPDNKNDEQTRMNTFLGFRAVHEGASTLESRLHSLTSNANVIVSNASFTDLKNPNYYLNLLPESLKKMKDNYADFIDAFSMCVKQFLKEFTERDQDNPLIGPIKEWANPGSPKFHTPSSQAVQNKKIVFHSTTTIDLGHETQNMQTTQENYVQLPNDEFRQGLLQTLKKHKAGSTYQRYYFLGSPFYQGTEPPKYKEETLDF